MGVWANLTNLLLAPITSLLAPNTLCQFRQPKPPLKIYGTDFADRFLLVV